VQSLKDASLWQILTVWQSREALDAMRRTGETPRGVLMFRAAGAEPTLSVLDLRAHGVASDQVSRCGMTPFGAMGELLLDAPYPQRDNGFAAMRNLA
jgi:hypothetical protein